MAVKTWYANYVCTIFKVVVIIFFLILLGLIYKFVSLVKPSGGGGAPSGGDFSSKLGMAKFLMV